MSNNTQKPVICLMGPTASGKTRAVMQIIKKIPIDIISVDSAMIYKGMDIGTGKPTKAELATAPHKLIDIIDAAQSYSAAQFCNAAVTLIKQAHANNKIPVLAGGTMMYFNALQNGISDLPDKDDFIREKINTRLKTEGSEKLHQELMQLDSVTAAKIQPTDPQRIGRALEVIEITGTPMSELLKTKNYFLNDFNVINFSLMPSERAMLHENIANRFHEMLRAGFIDEVATFYNRGDLNLELPAMRCVGYRQVWQYLAGEIDKNEMTDKAISATRQLAKRQLTWLRSWPCPIENFTYDTPEKINLTINKIIEAINLKTT